MRSGRIDPIGDDRRSSRTTIELDATLLGAGALAGLGAFSHAGIIILCDQVPEEKTERSACHPESRKDWPPTNILARPGEPVQPARHEILNRADRRGNDRADRLWNALSLQGVSTEGTRMVHDPKLLQPILAGTAPPDLDIAFRPMFGGIIANADGKPFASLSNLGLALKFIGQERDEMLSLPGAAPLRYEPDRPASKSYVLVPEPMLSQPEDLTAWVIRSVSNLPAKRTRKRA